MPMSPPSCFFQVGYYGAVDVPLMILQGDKDLLVDFASNAENAYARSNPPKSLVLLAGGNHLGFSDFGDIIDDVLGCSALPPPATLLTQIGDLVNELGGDANHVNVTGCAAACTSTDPTHILAARQRQVAKTVGAAFFDSILRSDAAASAYLAGPFAAANPDLTHSHTP